MKADEPRRHVAQSIVACRHGDPGREQPCPSMCPVQMWTHNMFRLRWFGRVGDRWQLKRRYRHLLSHPERDLLRADPVLVEKFRRLLSGEEKGYAQRPWDELGRVAAEHYAPDKRG